MGFPHSELVVLGAVVLAGILGKVWLAVRAGGGEPAEASPSLRRSSRAPLQVEARGRDEDVEEPVPESGIRVRQGARVRRVDGRKGG